MKNEKFREIVIQQFFFIVKVREIDFTKKKVYVFLLDKLNSSFRSHQQPSVCLDVFSNLLNLTKLQPHNGEGG